MDISEELILIYGENGSGKSEYIWLLNRVRLLYVSLSMNRFWAKVISGDLILKEAEESKWLSKNELDSIQCLLADIVFVKKYMG